jgi:hypothetical protein
VGKMRGGAAGSDGRGANFKVRALWPPNHPTFFRRADQQLLFSHRPAVQLGHRLPQRREAGGLGVGELQTRPPGWRLDMHVMLCTGRVCFW